MKNPKFNSNQCVKIENKEQFNEIYHVFSSPLHCLRQAVILCRLMASVQPPRKARAVLYHFKIATILRAEGGRLQHVVSPLALSEAESWLTL